MILMLWKIPPALSSLFAKINDIDTGSTLSPDAESAAYSDEAEIYFSRYNQSVRVQLALFLCIIYNVRDYLYFILM